LAVDLDGVVPSQEMADKLFPPNDIGPIWQKDSWGNYILPEYTLGWEILGWCTTWLGAIRGTGPLELTDEQARVILWFYALDDDGDFAYRQAVYQAFKGAGKDPFAAVLCVVELIGPCRFSHWVYDDDGNKEPVATDDPDALVQLVAVSKDQTRNTMRMIPKLLTKRVRSAFGLDVQKEIVYADDGRRSMQMVGSSAPSLEGNQATFAVLNETQHWTPSRGGVFLYDTVTDNVAKTGGRYICITNAPLPGEDSVAERVRNEQEKVWAGLAVDSGWLYMSREAHPDAPLHPDWVPFIMERIIGDAWWQRKNIKNLVKRVLDGSRPPSRTRRMYYNQLVTSEDAFFSMAEWDDARAEATLGTVEDLRKNDEVVLGFDGGKTDDATALVAIRIKDRLMVPLLVEQKPDGPLGENWEVDRVLVDEAVRRAFADYQVRAFFADVALWESYIMEWSETYREVLAVRSSEKSSIGWDMRGSREVIARGWESFYAAIKDGSVKHNGDKILRVHALNAKRGHNGKGLIARKDNPESPRKIDVMVAGFVAYMALQRYLEKGKRPARQYKRRMMQG